MIGMGNVVTCKDMILVPVLSVVKEIEKKKIMNTLCCLFQFFYDVTPHATQQNIWGRNGRAN